MSGALNAGSDILQRQFRVPNFVADLAKNFVNQAVQSNQKARDPQVDQFVSDKADRALVTRRGAICSSS